MGLYSGSRIDLIILSQPLWSSGEHTGFSSGAIQALWVRILLAVDWCGFFSLCYIDLYISFVSFLFAHTYISDSTCV